MSKHAIFYCPTHDLIWLVNYFEQWADCGTKSAEDLSCILHCFDDKPTVFLGTLEAE